MLKRIACGVFGAVLVCMTGCATMARNSGVGRSTVGSRSSSIGATAGTQPAAPALPGAGQAVPEVASAGASAAASGSAGQASGRADVATDAGHGAAPVAVAAASDTGLPQVTVALTPAAGWTAAAAPAPCPTQDTRGLRPWVTAAGMTLTVHLQNASDLCGAAGQAEAVSGAPVLQVTALGASGPVVGQTTLPSLPATLAPGTAVTAAVYVGDGLRPGYYVAALAGGVRLNGSGVPLPGTGPLAASSDFLVSSGRVPAGTVQVTSGAPPVVGGLAMPLVSMAWTGDDVPTFDIHAPVVCGPGTDRLARFSDVGARAAGPGWDSALPQIGGGQDPGRAQSTFSFGAFPAEATAVTLQADVQVLACDGSSVGGLLGSGTATWRVPLPPVPVPAGGAWGASARALTVASGPTTLSGPTTPLTFALQDAAATGSGAVRTITADVDIYPYFVQGQAEPVTLDGARFILELRGTAAGQYGDPAVALWSLPPLSATIAPGTSELLHVAVTVPAGVGGGQYALRMLPTPVPVQVGSEAATASPPDPEGDISATAVVMLPAVGGTVWMGSIAGGATGSNGYYHAQVTGLRCDATQCVAGYMITVPVPGGFSRSGLPSVTALGPDGRATALPIITGGGGGYGYSDGLYYSPGQLTFDPVPAGTQAVRIDIVTGPGFQGAAPVPITMTQSLG